MDIRKTDNRSLASKVALRRWLLKRMGFSEVRVLDTCAGLGHVWTAMEDHVTIQQWTRCDVKPRRPGTLALEALDAVKRFPLDVYNVIDIDPYCEPWAPYRAMLARLTQPTAVFLTHGHVMNAQVATANLQAVGLPADWPIPRTPALSSFVAATILAETWARADIRHAARMDPSAGVTYYALGLIPHASR